MMKHIARLGLLMTAFALVSACAHGPKPRFDGTERAVMNTESYLRMHPDMRWRFEGMDSLNEDRGAVAMAQFKRAARYADKASQAMIAEMLWTGRGVPADRPLAYAWMDIAAERAYVPFVAKREQYWAALSPAERKQALEVGRPLMAEYGDAVAKTRLARLLKRGKRHIVGSRVGFVGIMQILLTGRGGLPFPIDGERFYDDKFWEPEEYFAMQDSIWKDPPTGHVDVLPLEKVDEEGTQEAPPDADDGTP